MNYVKFSFKNSSKFNKMFLSISKKVQVHNCMVIAFFEYYKKVLVRGCIMYDIEEEYQESVRRYINNHLESVLFEINSNGTIVNLTNAVALVDSGKQLLMCEQIVYPVDDGYRQGLKNHFDSYDFNKNGVVPSKSFGQEAEDAAQKVIDSIQVVKPACKYIIGKWVVDENGLWRNGDVEIDFVKGVQNDNSEYRQGGVISEELIALCIKNLTFLNTGKFENEYTAEAIEHLKNALKCIKMRIIDRQRRGVYGYSKK